MRSDIRQIPDGRQIVPGQNVRVIEFRAADIQHARDWVVAWSVEAVSRTYFEEDHELSKCLTEAC